MMSFYLTGTALSLQITGSINVEPWARKLIMWPNGNSKGNRSQAVVMLIQMTFAR